MHQNRPITPGAFVHDGYLAVMVVGNLSPLYLALSEVYNAEQLNPLSASTSETSIYHHIEAPDMLGQRNGWLSPDLAGETFDPDREVKETKECVFTFIQRPPMRM